MNTDNKFKGELTVNLGGKEVACIVNMNAIRMALVNEKMSYDDLTKFLSKDPLTAFPKIVYYGMVNKALIDGKKVAKMDIEQFIAQFYAHESNLEVASETIGASLGIDVTREEEGNA